MSPEAKIRPVEKKDLKALIDLCQQHTLHEKAEFYLYLDCLFMAEGSRGFGIGEKLMDRIKEECKGLGCTHVQWQTPDFNTRAMKFYDRIGAKAKSKERYFWGL